MTTPENYAPDAQVLLLLLERLIRAEDRIQAGFRDGNVAEIIAAGELRGSTLAQARAIVDGTHRVQEVADQLFLRQALRNTHVDVIGAPAAGDFDVLTRRFVEPR